jgi:2-C-methyl-D-erythritol 4-phosphate cytidylyltransferase
MTTSRKVFAIIPAAGLGVRMGKTRKQFLCLDGTPILALTLRKFDACRDISGIYLAVRPEDEKAVREVVARAAVGKQVLIVRGGDTRQQSVENALRALPTDTDVVAVHDAVRPFVSPEQISAAIKEAERSGGSILGILCVDTVKQVERKRVTATIPRERIVLAQTPQVFRYSLLLKAFDQARSDQFSGTDEASLVERIGEEVTVVPGSPRNIKITTPQDLELAKWYLEQERREQSSAAKIEP